MAASKGNSAEVIKAKLITNSHQHGANKGLDSEYILGAHLKNEFSIGRHVRADCMIMDVQVSRWHATFKYDAEKSLWIVHDQGSQNGIHVNGKPLKSKSCHELKNGDKIGINDYTWSFQFPAGDTTNASGHTLINEGICQLKSFVVAKVNEKLASISAVDKKIKESEERQRTLTTERDNLLNLLRTEKEKFTANQQNERKKFEQKLSETKKEIAEAERRQFEKKMREDAENMEKKQMEMSASCEEKLKKVAVQVEETVKQRDALKDEIERLRSDAAKEKAAKEKEKTEREKMEEELKTKSHEIAKLNEALQVQQKRHESDEVSARKKLKLDFMSHCNNELKCPICDELFIDPVGLDCGHVYCDYCINQWKSTRKDKFTCPNCRKKVETSSKSLHIKNLIDSVFEGADASLKAEREEVIKERTENIKTASKPAKTTKKNNNFLATAPTNARPSASARTMPRRPPAAPSGIRSNGLPSNPRPIAPGGQVVGTGQGPRTIVVPQRHRSVSPVTSLLNQAQGLIRNPPSLNAAPTRTILNQVSQQPTVLAAVPASAVPGNNTGRRLVPVRILNSSGTGTSGSNAVVIDRRTVPVISLE